MIIQESTHMWELKNFDDLIKQEQLPEKYRDKTCYIYGEFKPIKARKTIDFDVRFYFSFIESFKVGQECEMITPEKFVKEVEKFNKELNK